MEKNMTTHSAVEPLYVLRRKPHTSISAVREYLMCPRKYFLHYVEQVPGAFRAAAVAFGSAWHSVIQYWLTREGVGQDELETYFRDDLSARFAEDRVPVLFDDEDENEGRLLDTGLKMLRVFFARVPRPEVVLGIEVPFSLELTHPMTGEVLGVPLIGAVDAIVADEGQRVIWELKTAKRRWAADQTEFDLQVSVYARLAARHLGHADAPVRLVIATKTVHPEVQVENPVRHEGDEREVLDVIFGVHTAVGAGVDYRTRGWQCRTCPFAEACRP
jgi:CRISPR/Cas system-associated exonuclease Cas4 (RecB family)